MDILVGVDGSQHSDAAARWAAREAKTIGAPLTLIHVYSIAGVPSPAGAVRTPEQRHYSAHQAEIVLKRARQVVDDEVGTAAVPVNTESIEGPVVKTLVDLSHGSRLLVLGTHSGRLMHHRLGSVVGSCLHEAACPVVVVPSEVPAAVPQQGAEPAPAT